MEEWLSLKIAADPSGLWIVKGTLADRPGGSTKMTFEIPGLDQSQLTTMIDELEVVEASFPVTRTTKPSETRL